MKKNILTIIIMAVSIVSLVLNIVLVFSVVPASNKTASLVDKVASVIDLNIDDPNHQLYSPALQNLGHQYLNQSRMPLYQPKKPSYSRQVPPKRQVQCLIQDSQSMIWWLIRKLMIRQ